MSLAIVGLLTTQVLAGGFMEAETVQYDQNASQQSAASSSAATEISEQEAESYNYNDWMATFDFKSCGVSDYQYQPPQDCGGYYSRHCGCRQFVRPCRLPCQQECAPLVQYNVTCDVPVTPNETVPEIPIPSGNITPPTPIVVTNCSYYKTCRQRPRCNVDKSWWDYWGVQNNNYDGGACQPCGQPVCQQPCQQKKMRRRICNATQDAEFDVNQFQSNSSYYDSCDCVVFQNCTNTTIFPPTTPDVPIPPIPSGGAECNYKCEDIRALHIVIANLTEQVQSQQSEIDMLIGQYQDLASKISQGGALPSGGASGSSANCCAKVDALNSDVADLYKVVNNITAQSSEVTLQRIRTDGVRFGNNWWMGEQGEYLFAIDITSSSYYRFQPAVNKTL